MSKRPVYMHELIRLADSLGDQMEALAKRAGPEHRSTVVSCVLACIRKRFSADMDERSALVLAVLNGDPLSAPSPKPEGQLAG
jgi:hypothetical protein